MNGLLKSKIISHVDSIDYVPKINKYVAGICFENEKKQSVWLTEKQKKNLEYNILRLRNGYSSKYRYVEAIFNDKGYYCYCKYTEDKKKRYFNMPTQYDLSDLKEED